MFGDIGIQTRDICRPGLSFVTGDTGLSEGVVVLVLAPSDS